MKDITKIEMDASWGLMIWTIRNEWHFEIAIGKRSTEIIYAMPFWKAALKFIFDFRHFAFVFRMERRESRQIHKLR